MKKRLRHTTWVVAVLYMGNVGLAHAATQGTIITRDATYEEDLHIQSNPDENKVTPARVLRWMMGMRGQDIMPPTSTEFQPVVDADQHRVRAVAAFAYKFF